MADVIKRIPLAYIYARISDQRGYDKGNSIPGQVERCRNYFSQQLAHLGVQLGGEEFDSFGVSASKIDFACRPAGARLIGLLRPGDHVIFDKPDRASRSMTDFCRLTEMFKQRDINVHFVWPGLDTSTPWGEMVIMMLMLFAKMESDMNSIRVKENNEIRRKQGMCIGKKGCMGTKVVLRGKKNKKYLVWHQGHRKIMARIVELRSADQYKSFDRISWEIEGELAAKAGRSIKKSAFTKRTWTPQKCREAFCMEVYLRDHGIDDVCDIPAGVVNKAIAYCQKLGLVGARKG